MVNTVIYFYAAPTLQLLCFEKQGSKWPGWSLGCPEYSNGKLFKNLKNSISSLIKSLIKIYKRYCQQLDFEAFPGYSDEHLNN